jgi:RNA polymerase sigma-70 factor (ECF subfamily)
MALELELSKSRSAKIADLSDEDLLMRCREQDELALKELLSRHQISIYNLLYRMLGCREDAEEALADVFVKVWRSAAGFKGKSRFKTWLYRIAANTARDMLRARKARPEVAFEDVLLEDAANSAENVKWQTVDPEPELVDSAALALLGKAMERLSDDDRLIISLYHLDECSLPEIAEILGQPRGSLKVRLFRARQKLRSHLAALGWENRNEMQSDTN